MSGYLFAHFTGEEKDGEQIYFALSRDGLFWKDLNGGKPVLYSEIGEKGVRDPFLVRDPKKEKYYLIATNLRIEAGKGWAAAQRAGSLDLIIWESDDLVRWFGPRACRAGRADAGCVWAPEAVYDEEKEAFFVFFASMVEDRQRIYGTYTKDFREFTEPFLYMEQENHVIDMTIVHTEGAYYRFSKDETNSRILLERGGTLDGVFEKVESSVLDALEGVEGPECYLLPDNRTWCLIVDRFREGKGYLPLLTKDLASGAFQILPEAQYDFGKNKKRHGGVLRLNDAEYERLWRALGDENPVLEGLYADPDLAYFDGTFYLYPTTDGFAGWSGTAFSVFSSEDGKHFENRGQLLDLTTEQVPWSIGSAWAPCIARKNGKYYFYFCGKNKEGVSCIGAASADSPTGPFTAEPEPMITMERMRRCGISMDQTIDPSVYTEGDDVYLLFGNGQPAIAKLSEDMLHIEEDTLANLEGTYDFREAVTVLKRGKKYYFSWSCDDTRSENYHVKYGVSDSLYGPIRYKGVLLAKDGESFGTGHHSICYIPEENRYLIAFHRFATPVKKYADGKGYNREVCIRELEFDDEDNMRLSQNLYRKTPLMGWASWNCFQTDISEERIKKQMDALVETGLADCGYVYANIDDGFFGGRAADGRLMIHKERFPNGIKVLADYAHERGLKAGIYSDAGDQTCGYYYNHEGDNGFDVGLYGHEEQDLNMYLDECGFDFIKVDWCGGVRLGLDEKEQYSKIGRIVDEIRHRTGRCLVYNICRWQFPGAWAAEVSDSWRTGADIAPDFASILHQIDNIKPLAKYCGPGHVNDLDMMQIGNGLSIEEEKTHFSMWCMMSTPLMLGCDLTQMRPETLEIVKNRELIAINQDAACQQAYPVREFRAEDGTLIGEIWIKDLGRKTSNEKAVAFLNRSDEPLKMSFRWEEAGLMGRIRSVRDLWKHEECECTDQITLTAAGRDAEIFKVVSERAARVPDPWDDGREQEKKAEKISMEEALRLVSEGGILVDVRSREDYRKKHLEGAVNLPYYDIHGIAERHLKDKKQPVIVYCATGKRSSQSADSLQYLGYEKVYDLGGIGDLLK